MMLKNILRRFLSLAMSAVMILALLPVITVPAQAADSALPISESLTVANNAYLKLSATNSYATSNGSVAISNGNTIKITAKGYKRSCDEKSTTTLIIENTQGAGVVVSYTVSSGSMTPSDKSNPVTIPTSGRITMKVTSGNGQDSTVTATITINSIELEKVSAQTTFQAVEHGGYTITYNGEPLEVGGPYSKTTDYPYVLTATPDTGYEFVGWQTAKDGIVDRSNPYEYYGGETAVVWPVFRPEGGAMYYIKGSEATYYRYLDEALTAAGTSGTIVVCESGTVLGTTGQTEFTIPSGVTLLVPFDDAATLYTDTPTIEYIEAVTPSAFRTLTIPSGTNITVADGGVISVGSKICAKGQYKWNGTPTGPHGKIMMQDASSITVNSNGKLCAYGYIAGSGSVLMKSGSTVYECFQITCWRGGTATCGSKTNLVMGNINPVFSDNRIFPMSQYYIQNVEVPLTLEAGAQEIVWVGANASSVAQSASATFIGNGGLFVPESGSITKSYDGENDRIVFDINGNTSLKSFTLEVGPITLNTKDYVMPINSNFTINIHSDTTSLYQDIALLPGVELNVDDGATVDLTIGYKVYFYDKDQWGNYTFSSGAAQISTIGYSTVHGISAKRSAATLTDAKMNINGTFITNGSIYTTKSGADITSSEGTGSIKLVNGSGSETTTYQATQSGSTMTKADIPITPAQLHNADNTYTTTDTAVAGDTYAPDCPYCNHWYKVGGHSTVKLYVDGSDTPQTLCSDTDSVTYSAVTSYVKMACDNANVQATAVATNGLTLSGLPAGVADVYIWTKAVAKIGETQYASLADAVNAYTGTGYIQMMDTSETGTISIDKDVYLDLNGQTVRANLVIAEGKTLYGMDCKTDDYDGTDAGKITGTVSGAGAVADIYQTAEKSPYNRYVAIQNGDELSFHRFNISVNGYRFELRSITPECALFFLGKFRGDSTARDYLKSVGFNLSIFETNESNETVKKPLADVTYEIAGSIPDKPADGESSESAVVFEDPDTYLFEAYLIRAFSKKTPSTYQNQFGAVATVTFANDESLTSNPKQLSYLDAWNNVKEISAEEEARLDAFLTGLQTTTE